MKKVVTSPDNVFLIDSQTDKTRDLRRHQMKEPLIEFIEDEQTKIIEEYMLEYIDGVECRH